MTISAGQCFLIAAILFALVGLLRGWLREIVTTAIILGSILFLSLGGAQYIGHFFTQTLPGTFNYAVNGTASPASGSTPSFSPTITLIVFGILAILGYLIGHLFGRPPTRVSHRLAGLIPGTVNGLAVSAYGTNLFSQASSNPTPTLSIQSLNPGTATQYYPLVFLVAIVIALIVLFTGLFGGKKAKK
jgi:hypothetical protein